MKNYDAHNMAIFKKGLKSYAKTIADEIMERITEVAQRMVEMIDGNFSIIDVNEPPSGNVHFPVWTANLHDATGVGVYRDGALTKYVPTKHAKWKQSVGAAWNDSGANRKGIDGFEELQGALLDGAVEYGQGIWIVLFSAVPYAYRINEEGSPLGRGQGFFNETSEGMLNEVLKGLAPLKMAAI